MVPESVYTESKKNIAHLADFLISNAIEALAHSYAPYSEFNVGAALMSSGGRVYHGANIESDIQRATHAEKLALDKAVFNKEREFYALAVVGKSPTPLYPCGQCLQDISEFDNKNNGDLIIIAANLQGKREITTLANLLPVRFTPKALGIDPRKF